MITITVSVAFLGSLGLAATFLCFSLLLAYLYQALEEYSPLFLRVLFFIMSSVCMSVFICHLLGAVLAVVN